ncbi:uncharacterized protein LOC126324059 [Schistocerca gregaria]|uniref:uncharacterized protein LOC126324059 n=1 Tax=Schistocerca gregaria TaxID=7010 RepID=UPI00211ECFE9|nr:uncharacterized protein LOC126324059 [Schistocerca gregaria]
MSKSVRKEKALERAVEIEASMLASGLAETGGIGAAPCNMNLLNEVALSGGGEEEERSVVDEDDIVEVERLQALGIGAADISRLKSANLHTVAGVMMRSKRDLMMVKGMTEAKVEKLLEACAKLNFSSFMTGVDLLEKRKSILRITTGSEALDKLLGGGIESTTITEAFGEFRTGKTQLAHTLCVTAQFPRESGGGNGRVAYIDTEGTFRPERVVPIAERFGIDPMQTLENIVYARAYNHDHQDALITTIAAKMVEEQYALLVVDSITALFRVDFQGREELAPRQQAIGQMMNKLAKVANEFNVAVFVTNQVCSDPSGVNGPGMAIADQKKPIGGNVLAHASTTRLSFRKGRGDQRICKVYDSPCLAEEEAVFRITNGGIEDVVDG